MIWQRLRNRLGEDHARGCQGRNYDCTCGFDNDGDKLVEDAAACIATLEAELAQARKAPESGEVAEMVTKLRLQRPTEQVGKQHYSLEETVTNMAQAAGLLTRLARERDAAIAERDEAEHLLGIMNLLEPTVVDALDRAEKAERLVETARADVLTAIEAEEELDGPIPLELLRKLKEDPECVLRANVRATKKSIINRIAALAKPQEQSDGG